MECRKDARAADGVEPGEGPSFSATSRLVFLACCEAEEPFEGCKGLRSGRGRSKGAGASLLARARVGRESVVLACGRTPKVFLGNVRAVDSC